MIYDFSETLRYLKQEEKIVFLEYSDIENIIEDSSIYQEWFYNNPFTLIAEKHAHHIQLLILQYYSIYCISTIKFKRDYKNNSKWYLAKFLMLSITNNIFSVLQLLLKGLDTSSAILMRSIFESYYILLKVLIDDEAIDYYVNNYINVGSKKMYYKLFSKKKLLDSISEYLTTNGFSKKAIESTESNFNKAFDFYSNLTHNDLFSLSVFGIKDISKIDEPIYTNPLGKNPIRIKEILNDLVYFSFFFNSIFVLFWVKSNDEIKMNIENPKEDIKGILKAVEIMELVEQSLIDYKRKKES